MAGYCFAKSSLPNPPRRPAAPPRNPLLQAPGRRTWVCSIFCTSSGASRGVGQPPEGHHRTWHAALTACAGLDPGFACSYRALWTLQTSLTPWVCSQDHELPTEAAARRWRDVTQRLPKLAVLPPTVVVCLLLNGY